MVESGDQRGIPVALEAGTSLGTVSVETSVSLQAARRMVQEQFSGSLPDEFVFLRNHAPVGMKQEKKLTVADCLPVLLLRDKSLRRASAPPTPGSVRAQPEQAPAATDTTMVALVSTSVCLAKPKHEPVS